MNINVFLYKVLNIFEEVYLINFYWIIFYVNYYVDSILENVNGYFFDLKDEKCIVCGDIVSVLKFGRIWRNFDIFDYFFD